MFLSFHSTMSEASDILNAVLAGINHQGYWPDIPELEQTAWDALEADDIWRKIMETAGDAVIDTAVTVVCIEAMPNESSETREVRFLWFPTAIANINLTPPRKLAEC